MKTVIIHGQSHEGSTCHIARYLAEKIGGETEEFFLPRDFGEFCVGCGQCFLESEEKCPHAALLQPFTRALDSADVIILESPVYVYHVTGAMKAFLDHYGWRWMVHRPVEEMFHKQGVCITTAAGSGNASACKDLADSMFFWGIPKIYKYGKNVGALKWKDVSEKRKQKFKKDLDKMALRIRKKHGRVVPGFKTRGFFFIMQQLMRRGFNPKDIEYWENKGWLQKQRPWKERT